MSHNKISFVTRKSFSSSPYIPYRLTDIDLSYNAIPVLTYDITFGTKKVKKLNISHNSINDIRRGKMLYATVEGRPIFQPDRKLRAYILTRKMSNLSRFWET